MPLSTCKRQVRKANHFTAEIDESFIGASTMSAEDTVPALSDFIIEAEIYEYPLADSVPAGYYACELQLLKPRIKRGKKILDVGYELIDRKGKTYYILQAYPLGSEPYKAFCRALIAAGIEPGPNMKNAIGVREAVELAYVSDNCDFGSIIRRIPEEATVAYTSRDEDDEMLFSDEE